MSTRTAGTALGHWSTMLVVSLLILMLIGCAAQQPMTAETARQTSQALSEEPAPADEADGEAENADDDGDDSDEDSDEADSDAENGDSADEEDSAAATTDDSDEEEADSDAENGDDSDEDSDDTADSDEDVEEEEEQTDDSEAESSPQSSQSSVMDLLEERTRHYEGDEDAPVTIIEFSDFQCGYCKKFSRETMPQIEENFIDEGIVRVGYRHAAYQGEGSLLAAEASECAADQDAFWPYHHALIEVSEQLTEETLTEVAEELDLDVDEFETCLSEGKYEDLVFDETQDSHSLFGVQGTPTFIVNGMRVVGAQPYDTKSGCILIG